MIEFINDWSRAWITFFGPAVVQNTIFLGCVFLALYLLKNGSAQLKYTITMIGMIKLLLPPFIPAPFWSESATYATTAVTTMSIQPALIGSSLAQESTIHMNLLGYLCGIWLLGVTLFVLIPLISTLMLRHRLQHAEIISQNDSDVTNKSIRLLKSNKISMPLSIGVNPKKIFVPSLWDKWSDECRSMILHHELAHIQRRDGIVQLLQTVVQAIYFFHPLIWLLNKRMNEYRELACDDVTVGGNEILSVKYSRYLVEIAEEMTQTQLGCSSASALIRQKNELLNRVQHQMEDAMTNISKKKVGVILIGLILLFTTLSWTKSPPKEAIPIQTETKKNDVSPPRQKQSKEQEEEPTYIKHDISPLPVGGYEAIQKRFKYPESARGEGIKGRSMIWAKIGTDGTILLTKVMKSIGHTECDEAAMEAIRSVEWKPAMKDGKPIAIWVAVPFDIYENQEFLEIYIKSTNNIIIDGKTTTKSMFAETIKERLKMHEDIDEVSISLLVSKDVTMGTVDDMFKILKEMDISRMGTRVVGSNINIK